jgi:Tfp pilus assembly protein PilF
MKPKIQCSSCGRNLSLGDQVCAGCGKPIEWPDSISSLPGVHASGKKEGQRSTYLGTQAKIVAVVVVLIVGVALAFELLTGTKNRPVPPQAQNPSQMDQGGAQRQGANMAALPQIEQMEAQLKANPSDHELMLRIANVLQDNRFFDKAIAYYRQYLEHHPGSADALVDLGICYHDTGQLEEAKKTMTKALDIDPKHVNAHFNLGIVALNKGDVEEANTWFRKTIALSPSSAVGQRAQQLLTPHANLQNPLPQ